MYKWGPFNEPIQACMRIRRSGKPEWLIGCSTNIYNMKGINENSSFFEYPECRYFVELEPGESLGPTALKYKTNVELLLKENIINFNTFYDDDSGYYGCYYGVSFSQELVLVLWKANF